MSDVAFEIARLRTALVAQTACAQAAEIELAQARALALCMGAMIQELKREIAKLRRDTYGISSERRARLIDQLEKPEVAATEDALAAKQAASGTDATVCAVTRRKPMRCPLLGV
jgi:transposase